MAVRKNFSYSTVAVAPSPATSGTSLTVGGGDGTKFTRGPVTIWPPNTQPLLSNAEIAVVTAISTDTLTIVRGQQGSTAQSVVAGWQIAQTVTAGIMQWYNVKDFGAVGDGSNDDTVAIQNAINAAFAEAIGTSTVFFPAGQYKTTAALVASSATVSTSGFGAYLRGAGHNASQILKTFNGNGVTFNGNGGPASNPTQFGGMVDLTVNGNGHTGSCVQTNSANQMFFRGCSFIGNSDVTWDFNTMQDSYFSQCTFNNCGSNTQPVISLYGSSGGTTNMLWFDQIRVESFFNGAIWIKRGAGATGGGNNGFFFSQVKLENFPTVNGDVFVADSYTQQLYMDQIFFSIGQYNSGYSTPANMIVFGSATASPGLNQASFTNIFVNAGPTANICNSVININDSGGLMEGPVKIDNIYLDATPNTAMIISNGASNLTFDIGLVKGATPHFSGDATGKQKTILCGLILPYLAKSGAYTVLTSDYFIDCTSGTFTVTLPTAVGITGQEFVVKNSGAGTITVGTTSAQTIDGSTTRALGTQYMAIRVMSDGANWKTVGEVSTTIL